MRLRRLALAASACTAVVAVTGAVPAHAQSLSMTPYWTGRLINVNSGKCLEVYNWSKSTSATIDQWTCGSDQWNQLWNFIVPDVGGGTIIQNKNSGLCLTDNGAPTNGHARDLSQKPCSDSLNESWAVSSFTGGSLHIQNLG